MHVSAGELFWVRLHSKAERSKSGGIEGLGSNQSGILQDLSYEIITSRDDSV